MSQLPATPNHRWDQWELHRVVTPKTLFILLTVFVLLSYSAHNVEMDKAFVENAKAVGSIAGLNDSRVVDNAISFLEKAFPLQISDKTAVNRLDEGVERNNLPLFSRIEVLENREYDLASNSWTIEKKEYLVKPFGYLKTVAIKMWETIEMGFWGTILSIMISLPLSILASRNYTPHKIIYALARGWLGVHRSMPELIIALIFVLMYGFGPIAGIFALAVHTSGVLGKFFADEIENAPPGPQQALRSAGASRLKVLRYAVFPHVLPAWIGYVQYIFERNIRTATVLGIVGAGGIGMELKGRWDLFDYDHVATILLMIFITVMLLEFISQKLRGRTL